MNPHKPRFWSPLAILLGTMVWSHPTQAETIQIPEVLVRFSTADQKPLPNRAVTLHVDSSRISTRDDDIFFPFPSLPHRKKFTAVNRVLGRSDSRGEFVVPKDEVRLGLARPFEGLRLFSNGEMGESETGCFGKRIDLQLRRITPAGPVQGCLFEFSRLSDIPAELRPFKLDFFRGRIGG